MVQCLQLGLVPRNPALLLKPYEGAPEPYDLLRLYIQANPKAALLHRPTVDVYINVTTMITCCMFLLAEGHFEVGHCLPAAPCACACMYLASLSACVRLCTACL